ncbi:hypothetical protein RJ640_008529 [Escallonia rubra]|uniref:HXXXD-type acyl-transferase family protein n=1 Tax=Escallonia rubra TaxID=112253 RepID=A0AA88R7E5_9ASTE|nr:hypothetical protein RJ640_008529 [Escallonia rubra]
MADICIISTCTVRPATAASLDEPTRKIELTPWDLQFLLVDSVQKGILFRKPTLQQEQKALINHLKASLSRTLDFFLPLAGRLAQMKNHNDNTTSFFINCNNAGAQFDHATVNELTVADILQPVYIPRIVQSFFPLNGVLNHEGISKPLLAVQVTELADGFFLGCTINHVVADGTSFWHFISSWSEISRGYSQISKTPLTKRYFPEHYNCLPIRIPFFEKQLISNTIVSPGPLKERVFHFSAETISKLKAKANAEVMSISTGQTITISSLQAVLAHLWLSVIRCRGRDENANQEISFKIAIGARPRLLHPPLGEGYLGNAIHFEAVTTSRDELLKHGLGWAAWQFKKKVASQTPEEVTNFYESWVKNPKLLKKGILFRDNSASSSPRFNVYESDFGWGKPVAVRSGLANKFDGKVTIFPGGIAEFVLDFLDMMLAMA